VTYPYVYVVDNDYMDVQYEWMMDLTLRADMLIPEPECNTDAPQDFSRLSGIVSDKYTDPKAYMK
jgi:hypothetical protein